MLEVKVPDIGDFKDVPVIEVLVKSGDVVKAEDALVTLESDKATMDVPAPLGGTIRDVRVRMGDRVSEGSVIVTLATDGGAARDLPFPTMAADNAPAAGAEAASQSRSLSPTAADAGEPSVPTTVDNAAFALAYAGPGVRKLARELGVDLSRVSGSGERGRVVREDVEAAAKTPPSVSAIAQSVGGSGLDVLCWPKVDFAKFGSIEAKPLSRMKKISGANLHRNWVMIPHVTNHDDADITELEPFRVQLNGDIEKSGVRVSMLAFLIRAAAATLRVFPDFNASLDGDNLVLKQYVNIGFAADTPQGLVVPVIRSAGDKGIVAIAKEIAELAKLARDGKLKPDQMQGGCFTISSLGGIGGTYFTPIINAPEVANLGVCRAAWRQVSSDGLQGQWRLMLPLSLSYDHRVIDGAAAARFTSYLASVLSDIRRSLL